MPREDYDPYYTTGWYSVRFYARSRPHQVGTTVQLFLRDRLEIIYREDWLAFLPELKRLVREGKLRGMPKFLQNYQTRFKTDWPGAYSIGPFQDKRDAIQAVYDTDQWWKANADKFVGTHPRTPWGVIDVTEPSNWVVYRSSAECAEALGVSEAQVNLVCNLHDRSVKGRVLRHRDPGGYGVPVVPIGGGKYAPDLPSLMQTPMIGNYRPHEPGFDNLSSAAWSRKDRVHWYTLAGL